MSAPAKSPFAAILTTIRSALAVPGAAAPEVEALGRGSLPSVFPVSDLAMASIAAAGLGIAERLALAGRVPDFVRVDRRLASLAFDLLTRPLGWTPPPAWDPIAGDYLAREGWIRLHTNAPHHRDAALAVLAVTAERSEVARAVATWSADDLETAVVAQGGCAAAMRSRDAWARHPQGVAVAAEPLIWNEPGDATAAPEAEVDPARPLAGVRVLDLTRVLAGPVATRFLAGYGANVLRIDPPLWDEPALLPEVMVGKRSARLDLKTGEGREILAGLLARADVFVNGYRSDALEKLGLGAEARRAIRPGLVDVRLDAYGWTGPWAARRGFDSLVQMSAGVAHAGMVHYAVERPRPLPVQALDQAAGYLLAASALAGLNHRTRTRRGSLWRTSLARVAALLTEAPPAGDTAPLAAVTAADYAEIPEDTGWGQLRRLRPPLEIAGAPMFWTIPAGPLGHSPPAW